MLLIISCKINYIREKQSYVLLSPKMCDGFNPVLFKFDTGASFTSITLGSLIDADKITKREQEILRKQILNLDYPHQPLISASDHEMTGILCYTKKIILSGQMFENFYFYLIPEFYKKALLGADFISCCNFTHELRGEVDALPEIYITKFFYSIYKKYWKFTERTKSLQLDSLSQMCDFVSNSKIIKVSEETPSAELDSIIAFKEI